MREKEHLEEFRRKKAAEKAKKATSVTQFHASNDALHEKQSSETDHVRLTDAHGVGTSGALAEGPLEPSGDVAKNESKEPDTADKSDFSSNDIDAKPSLFTNKSYVNSSVLENSYLNNEEFKGDAGSVSPDGSRSANDKSHDRMDDDGLSAQFASGNGNDHFLAPQILSIQETDRTSIQSSFHGVYDHSSIKSDGPENDLSRRSSGTTAGFSTDMLSQNSFSDLLQDKSSTSGRSDNILAPSPYPESIRSTLNITDSIFGDQRKNYVFSDIGDRKLSDSVAHTGNVNHLSPSSDNRDADYYSDPRGLSNHAPPSPPAAGRRFRPSFLDSIQVSKGLSSSPPIFGDIKADSSSAKVYPLDGLGSSISQRSVASGDGVDLVNHVMENKHDFFSRKQNEDFAALEQHIEDLTQEKFSFQRALEASRALTENLAAENSSMTDSFNQQGGVVNQLKLDLEKLQEEIRAQLVELEAVRIQYSNAQMECNAADERAKLLASELIGWEEKSLRLRSNELRLEKQLENSQAEILSCRKKMSSLEKDRQDLQSTVDALREEKKLLQSKLLKNSASGKSIEANKISYTKKDVSTSTEDLDINTTAESSNSGNFGTSLPGDDSPTSQFPHENILLGLEGLPMSVPSDQLRIVQNIDTLIAELVLEKDQFMQALSAESSQSSKLLELNKELTRKLEAQTQRLELLTAQSMANDIVQPRQPDPRTVHDNMAYADEGDEVVERVLGWIMKLFPGGPSRLRTSKHL
ncbi:hypothetical protein ACJIZ3_013662 [Penstemon smallii]|uniref:Uncharacterized protein n=1 Tax=Penstemon smallii TaxID=265156 RepID=A0ABD3RH81_9LAMI